MVVGFNIVVAETCRVAQQKDNQHEGNTMMINLMQQQCTHRPGRLSDKRQACAKTLYTFQRQAEMQHMLHSRA
jgi:hypothetical protein